jgi:hypothetical protein
VEKAVRAAIVIIALALLAGCAGGVKPEAFSSLSKAEQISICEEQTKLNVSQCYNPYITGRYKTDIRYDENFFLCRKRGGKLANISDFCQSYVDARHKFYLFVGPYVDQSTVFENCNSVGFSYSSEFPAWEERCNDAVRTQITNTKTQTLSQQVKICSDRSNVRTYREWNEFCSNVKIEYDAKIVAKEKERKAAESRKQKELERSRQAQANLFKQPPPEALKNYDGTTYQQKCASFYKALENFRLRIYSNTLNTGVTRQTAGAQEMLRADERRYRDLCTR